MTTPTPREVGGSLRCSAAAAPLSSAETTRRRVMAAQPFETVIVGGGQAGLATGHYLRKAGRSFVILDASDRVGDPWRNRWDSLRLYSPAAYDGLPGLRFPAKRTAYPTTHE